MRPSFSFDTFESPAMRRISFSLLIGLIAGSMLLLAGCDSSGSNGGGSDGGEDESTITEVAQNDDRFSILADLVARTDLDDNLGQQDATLTVFAPTDQAFLNALDSNDNGEIDDSEIPENAASILQYHVLKSVFYAANAPTDPSGSQIPDGETDVTTLEGSDVTIDRSGGDVTINPSDEGASVVASDVDVENGVVHGIDTVLMPGNESSGNDGGDDGNDGGDNGTGDDNDSQATITGVAQSQNNLSTLVSALQAAGLDQNLDKEDRTFTVFAPKNSAFSSIETGDLTGNSSLLEKVLKYHVVVGQEITSGDISDGETQTVETFEGKDLTISKNGGTVTVNGATVTTADVQASNGVVHLIDGVLLKRANAVERASISPNFSILTDLVEEEGLANTLSGPGPDGEDGLTVFAPTDQAFLNALDSDDSGEIENDEVPDDAGDILKYHVLDDVFFAGDVPTSETDVPTLEGSNATVVRSGSDVTINPNDDNASVVAPNVDVSNGVIHGIDTVLIP